jgi:putative Holliday junction resolvase
LVTITRASRQDDVDAIGELVEDHSISRIVVGLPLSLDGTEGPQARSARRYAEFLSKALSVEIDYWDERYSTVDAGEILCNRTKRSKRGRGRGEIDAVAAAVILQAYLDAKLR